jgi:AcrR family transcriptional regulator
VTPDAALRTPRARRGSPDATRERLIAAAAADFEARGYHGTDTNRIARAAGYAPGTFYKHFVDKRAAFLAVYDTWMAQEWGAIDRAPDAAHVVDFLLAHHRRWKGFRASLRALLASDAKVRAHHRRARRRQVERVRVLAPRLDATGAALLLLQVERICDAAADGELAALGADRARAREALIGMLTQV